MSNQADLNPAQREAVEHSEGPVLIIAGAGSGKTRVITERIARLIRSGTAAERILAVTFTNKAAGEMRERVRKLASVDPALSPYETPPWPGRRAEPFIGTFHALSLHIIKTFHRDLGLPARFTIYDRQDSTRAAREAIQAAGFDPKELEPGRVIGVMSRKKGETVDLATFRERAASYIDEAIAEVWERYDAILRKEKALDFDDILAFAHRLLLGRPEARAFFENAWEYVHVDEYQDTNRVQYEIVRLIAGARRNIAVVGDADQNIYSWRGASIEHILNFEHDFPGATVIPLTENYRSTQTILRAANDAIAKNERRKEKSLVTRNGEGEPLAVAGFPSESEEAAFAAAEAGRRIAGGASPDDIAVLYRTNFQSRILEEAFLSADIPYQVLGTRFFERKEVKDALAYLRCALNPESAGDFARAIQTPTRGIGKVTLAKALAGMEHELPAGARGKLAAFRETLAAVADAARTKKASDAVRETLRVSGLERLYEKGSDEDAERLANLKELVTVATKYDAFPAGEGLEKLLEEAVLRSDQDELGASEKEKKEGVKLMTIHAAKGLEFGTVFVTGLEDGLFPHERDGSDNIDDEEERRLFYVALTRAKKKVYLTYAMTRRIFGTRVMNMPSEFVTELDPSLVEVAAFDPTHELPSIT